MRSWPPWKAWMLRQPTEAGFVLGGFWGLLMFALAPTFGGQYDVIDLVLALALGILVLGPLWAWRFRRRSRG